VLRQGRAEIGGDAGLLRCCGSTGYPGNLSIALNTADAELARRNVSYRELAERLESMSVKRMNGPTISNKVNRGGFTAVFFLQCMEAIGVRAIHIDGDG
jgi:Domain of unknown function (DUF6471)